MSSSKAGEKLTRDHRMILASFIASKCGLSTTEADLAAIARSPDRELCLRRFCGGKAELRRVELAISLLAREQLPANKNERRSSSDVRRSD